MSPRVGDVVRVGPAYSMETRTRSIHDEATGLVGTVVRVSKDGDLGLARGVLGLEGVEDPRGLEDVAVHQDRCEVLR